jgi:hypothetical protein
MDYTQCFFKTIEFFLINFFKNKNISSKLLIKFIIQQYYIQLLTLFYFDCSNKSQIIYRIKVIPTQIIHIINFLYFLNLYIEKFHKLYFYFKPYSYNYFRIIWRILIDKFDFYFLLENIILNFFRFFLKFTRIFYKKIIYLFLDYIRLIFSLFTGNFVPQRIIIFLIKNSFFNNYKFFFFFLIYNSIFESILKKASNKYILQLAFKSKKLFLYRCIYFKAYFLNLKRFLVILSNKKLSQKFISHEIALSTFPIKTVLFNLFKFIYIIRFATIKYNHIPNLYNKIKINTDTISKKNIDFFLYYNIDSFKYLLKIAFLIFFEKHTKFNCIKFIEMKLGKYLLIKYLNIFNLDFSWSDLYVYLCMYNNKYIFIYIKYISRFIKTCIPITNILKKNLLIFIIKLIGLKIYPVFFFIKIFKRIFIVISNDFTMLLLINLIKLKTLFRLDVLKKSIKQSFFFEKKNQYKKSPQGCKKRILEFNHSTLTNFYIFSLYLLKKKVNIEFKQINILLFRDFKNFSIIE